MNREPDVLIIGAGPAGLSAARALGDLGIDKVLVVDREPEAGGIPRFCPHPTFGLAEFFRPMSGPAYAAKLRARVDPGRIMTSTTALSIGPDRETLLSSLSGEVTIRPKRLLLATGIRETPRSARLVSGDRPKNILTTGALQRILTEGRPLPFKRPVIVGTELVSFSALLSLRDAGVTAVAMIEEGERIVARRPADWFARFLLRTPIRYSSRLTRINAAPDDAGRLQSVTITSASGIETQLACDAVIFTGRFTPEASLLGHDRSLLDEASRGPAIDQHWRLASDGVYAAGNVLRGVETSAWCAREGAAVAWSIAADLRGQTGSADRRIPVTARAPIAFSTPSFIAPSTASNEQVTIGIRMATAARGRIVLAADGKPFWQSGVMTARPERRILISPSFPDLAGTSGIELFFEGGG
jgi:NADPH-dependent 2,4-dienoyl-CoA reductase/sulfur reductase-like enzyme